MISARLLARSFSGFWAELLPLLTPTFVHMVNEGYKHSLIDDSGAALGAVFKRLETSDSAAIAEFGFHLAKVAVESGLSVQDAFWNDDIRISVVRKAIAIVESYDEYQGGNPALLIRTEEEEGLALALNYERFLRQYSSQATIIFHPQIPGAGFIPSCEADLSIGGSLFEVKTVGRNLASKDIRQLLVYLALQAATGERKWRSGGFFNPRRATYHEFEVDELVSRMSGGISAAEVFREIVEFASVRDIQLDASF